MLRDRLALTDEGARSLRKGALVCALANLVLMFPVGVVLPCDRRFLRPSGEDGAVPLPDPLAPYLALIAVVLAAVFADPGIGSTAPPTASVYQESARKRDRPWPSGCVVLPLSFFGKRDLADLTTRDHEGLPPTRSACSCHTMPQAVRHGHLHGDRSP